MYFDDQTPTKELLQNCGDDHQPESICKEAEQRLKRRGWSQGDIDRYTSLHDLDD